jgi:hypothetical protein
LHCSVSVNVPTALKSLSDIALLAYCDQLYSVKGLRQNYQSCLKFLSTAQ